MFNPYEEGIKAAREHNGYCPYDYGDPRCLKWREGYNTLQNYPKEPLTTDEAWVNAMLGEWKITRHWEENGCSYISYVSLSHPSVSFSMRLFEHPDAYKAKATTVGGIGRMLFIPHNANDGLPVSLTPEERKALHL